MSDTTGCELESPESEVVKLEILPVYETGSPVPPIYLPDEEI